MGNEWEGPPKWVREGRTGPNGPRYSSRRDRARVRREYNRVNQGGCVVTALCLLSAPVAFLGMFAHWLFS